jgi:hypothetical protein
MKKRQEKERKLFCQENIAEKFVIYLLCLVFFWLFYDVSVCAGWYCYTLLLLAALLYRLQLKEESDHMMFEH